MSETKIEAAPEVEDDGGPVFPSEQGMIDGVWNQTYEAGMSLRDYFIAHAPAEPQAWFTPKIEPDGPSYPAWEDEYQKQRYIQWPSAWADAMLKARKKVVDDYVVL